VKAKAKAMKAAEDVKANARLEEQAEEDGDEDLAEL